MERKQAEFDRARYAVKAPSQSLYEPEEILKRDRVTKITSLTRSTLQKYVKSGLFPLPLRLGNDNPIHKRIGWKKSEVLGWIESRERVKWID